MHKQILTFKHSRSHVLAALRIFNILVSIEYLPYKLLGIIRIFLIVKNIIKTRDILLTLLITAR